MSALSDNEVHDLLLKLTKSRKMYLSSGHLLTVILAEHNSHQNIQYEVFLQDAIS